MIFVIMYNLDLESIFFTNAVLTNFKVYLNLTQTVKLCNILSNQNSYNIIAFVTSQ